jgi:hypothetical protein
MRPGPPKVAETIAGFLIPPACREEVLGDLHERYTGPGQYLMDALYTAPLVIASRIRRTTDPQVFLMEALLLYVSFLGAAWYRDETLLNSQWGLLRLAVPGAIALVALMLEDAYASPGKRSALKLVRGPVFGLGVTLLWQAVLAAGSPELALPRWIMFSGSAISLLLVSTVRVLFPPVTDRPQRR